MQRKESAGIVISCDFCGTDWDEVLPMIEGHHGSILCLECFKQGMAQAIALPEPYTCTLCLRDNIPSSLPRWTPDPLPENANPQAIVCQECLMQAAKTFDRDPDVEWTWQRKR